MAFEFAIAIIFFEINIFLLNLQKVLLSMYTSYMNKKSKPPQQIQDLSPFILNIYGGNNNIKIITDKNSSSQNSLNQNNIFSKIKNYLPYICIVQFFQDKIILILNIIFNLKP